MRKFWLAAGMAVFCWSVVFGEVKKGDPLAPLSTLKPWEVPFVEMPIQDARGAVDTLWMDLQKGGKPGEWVLYLSVFNDESLFALSFTLRHDSLMTVDSMSVAGTRLDFFETKIMDKKPRHFPHTVTMGLFSALNPTAPSLAPGKGTVLKLFYHAPPERPISVRSVAPILMPPSLSFVMPGAQATIRPVIVRVGDAPPPKPVKTPSKTGK